MVYGADFANQHTEALADNASAASAHVLQSSEPDPRLPFRRPRPPFRPGIRR